jgi:hypothetical protein
VIERTFRPANVASAALVLGGLMLLLRPQYAVSIVQLVLVTIAAAAGLYAFAVNAPAAWWLSPFEGTGRAVRRRRGYDETDRIRATMSGRRQEFAQGPALPPETVRIIQPLIRAAVQREGLDPADRESRETARSMLSPLSYGVLMSDARKRPPWFRMLPPDERTTADVVRRVLDDLERLADGVADVPKQIATRDPGRQ